MAKKRKRGNGWPTKRGNGWPTRHAAKHRGWTTKDVRELKSLAKKKTPARKIGRKLGRTEGAVRQKAFAEGVSFSSRTRARRKRRK